MNRHLPRVLFGVLAAAVLIAHVVVAWHSLTVLRLWEDEAFNLTVPRNLLAGLGYTSDGTLTTSTLTPFDVRISTGPTVLLPVAGLLATGIDPVVGARLVPLAFWAALLGGLVILGRRIAGPWGALAAATLPLALDTGQGFSPIQGPADLLGEIPAAALIVWALVVLPRRPWLAGLLLGFALQAKLIAALALPAFAVALFLLAPHAPVLRRLLHTLRRGILPLLLVALPTALMEAATFVALGPQGYRGHLHELREFLQTGGQQTLPTPVSQKLETFLASWFLPPWAVMAVMGLLAAGIVLALVRSPLLRGDSAFIAVTVASTVGLVVFIGWWAQASQTPLWIRHPSPGIFAFAPVLVAAGVRAIGELWREGDEKAAPSWAARGAAVVVSAAVVVPLALGGSAHAARSFVPSPVGTLSDQRTLTAPLKDWAEQNNVDWIAANPWGIAVPFIVLSGAHVGLATAPAMEDVDQLVIQPCPGEVVFDTGHLHLCAP